jgi:hypothetical protein
MPESRTICYRCLDRHHASLGAAVRDIAIEVTRQPGGRLRIGYHLEGDMSALVVPEPAPPLRTNELWRSTCLEAFVRLSGSAGYLEFNLCPSGRWAAYSFSDRRSGMTPLPLTPPETRLVVTQSSLNLEADLDLSDVMSVAAHANWSLNITAVTLDRSGKTSWWALNHPCDVPDFHHPEGFVLDLPVPKEVSS